MPGRCLIVEDNDIYRSVLEEMATSLGLHVTVAMNGAEAIDLLKNHAFDLMLMDGQMPVLDGYQTAEKIRNGDIGEDKAEIPIIGLTGNSFPEDIMKYLKAGANEVLGKPVSIEMLKTCIEKFLHKSKKTIEPEAIERLRSIPGKPALVNDLIVLLQKDTPLALAEMRHQIEILDLVGLSKTAHHLKSSCAGLGAARMLSAADRLEHARPSSPIGDLKQGLDLLEREFHQALIELKKYQHN